METRDTVFFVVMILSSFILSFEWLRRFPDRPSNPLIILSVMILIGTLSAMLISLNRKIEELEDKMEAKDRALRLNIEGIESNMEDKMNEVISKIDNATYEINRRKYH